VHALAARHVEEAFATIAASRAAADVRTGPPGRARVTGGERERINRTRFAQRALKPADVRQELEATDTMLGDPDAVRSFVLEAALTPEEIRQIRLREKASQAVFARYLNVTTGRVSQWERGEKHPRGASLKLLTLIAKKGLQAVA
jgi:DNA-binding transcriptional regulator YiaG